MKTLKELEDSLSLPNDFKEWYYIWYKDAITWILEDLRNSSATSVETIEKYLQDLLNK